MVHPSARPDPSRGEPPRGSGIPDGLVVGGIAFLLALVTTAWLATGLGGLLQHGTWPSITFAHTAVALRRLASAPSDIEGAWQRGADHVEGLPSPAVFWTTSLILVVVLITLGILAAGTWAALRRPPAVVKPRPGPAPSHNQAPAEQHLAGRGEPAPTAPTAPVESASIPEPRVPPATPVPAAECAPSGRRSDRSTPQPASRARIGPSPSERSPFEHPLSEQALVPRARTIRPEIPVIGRSLHDALAYAVPLGHDSDDGTELYGGLDHTFCVFGPPRSGRTSRIVTSAITGAPGPVLVTCDGPDTLRATLDARAQTGPVLVFDPLQLTESTAGRLRWSPVDGCEDPTTAEARARALLEPVRPLARTLLTDTHTQQTAQTLLRCWLHAAALDKRPFRQVHRWAGAQNCRDAVKILRTAKDAAADWAGSLESTLSGHQQQSDTARALVARALDALSQLHILNSCTPSASERLRVESFLRERGTLYVVGEGIEDPRTRPGVLPLLTALVENVVEHGRRMAATSSSGRLDPPLLAALDDIATVAPIPTLPELVSVGGRVGIPVIAVLRSEEQARHRWGDRGAATIQQSANIRITMDAPGTAKIQFNDHSPVTSRLPQLREL